MASLALSSYEFLEVWPDKASQRLPISWLSLSCDSLLFIWCSVNGPLPKRPICTYSWWQKQIQYPTQTASQSRHGFLPNDEVKSKDITLQFGVFCLGL
jgi:hypothetical protein